MSATGVQCLVGHHSLATPVAPSSIFLGMRYVRMCFCLSFRVSGAMQVSSVFISLQACYDFVCCFRWRDKPLMTTYAWWGKLCLYRSWVDVPSHYRYYSYHPLYFPLYFPGLIIIIIIKKGHSLRRACLQPETNTQNSKPRPPTMSAFSWVGSLLIIIFVYQRPERRRH